MNKEELVDKIIREWSFRCKKGYPDLGNEKDLKILKETFGITLEQKKEFNYLNSESRQLADKLLIILDLDKTSIEPSSKKNFAIRAPKEIPRMELVDKIHPHAEELGLEFKSGGMGSSIGGFIHKDLEIKVIFKDEGTRRMGAAGKDSEKKFYTNVKKYIEEYESININIILRGDNRVEPFKDVTEVVDTSKINTKEGERSDMKLYSGKDVIANLSLKKDGPFRWASVKGMFSDFVKGFFEKSFSKDSTFPILLREDPRDNTKFLMYDREEPTSRITKVVVENIHDYDEAIVFGPEVPKPLIVGRTFKDKDFTFNTETNTLQVSVSEILKDMDEIVEKGLQPVFVINQHIRRKYGIEFRIFAKKYGGDPGEKAKAITIDYNQAF